MPGGQTGAGKRDYFARKMTAQLVERLPQSGSPCQTFKGMTDQILAWQTDRLLELETQRDKHVV